MSIIECPFTDTQDVAIFNESVETLAAQYQITDPLDYPQRQMLIQRAAVLYTGLLSEDRRGTRAKTYAGDHRLLRQLLSELMRYNEAVQVQYSLREAREGQERLKTMLRDTLCTDCLKKLRDKLV